MNTIHSQLCAQRVLPCRYCRKDFTCKDLKTHFELCESFPIKCDAEGCDVTLPRNLISKHQTKECQFTIVTCEWSEFGCNHKATKKEMKNHHFDSVAKHLDCVKNVMTRILGILPQDQVKEALSDLNKSENEQHHQRGLSSSSLLVTTSFNESFEIHSNSITDEQLLQKIPPQHTKLKKLDLSECEKLTDHSITQITQNCTQLQRLALSHCNQITDHSIATIGQNCKRLLWLDVTGCTQITNNSLIQLSQSCPQLQVLGLSHCTQITNSTLVQLSQNCKQLQILSLYDCKQITDKSIIQVSQNCPQLQALVLDGCKQITNHAVSQLAQNNKQLQILNLIHCKQVTDEAVISVAKNCVELHTLYVNHCHNVSKAVRDELKNLGIKFERKGK